MATKLNKVFNDLPLLPPNKSLVETIAILKQESKSAVALAELKGLTNTLPNPNILINAVILKEAQASSGIENVITTQDKLYQALYAKSTKPDGATKEVLRYREALLMGTRLIKERGFLNTNGIIAIQKELEENNAGLRKLPGTALINDLTNEVIYTPPDNFDTISNLMENLEEYLNNDADDISPLIKLAIQHYQFESIHPFYDGNGRTGRIINVLFLILKGLLNEPVLYLSSYIIQNKGDYYRLLQEVRTKNNWEDWILYMLKGIEQTAQSTIEQINKIKHLFSETQKLVQDKLPRIYSKDLIEQLYIHPYCKIEFLVNNLGIERKAASRYLSSLEELGVLKSQQKGKEVIYINTKLYNLLKKG
ncbi:Fic family protein [Algoriphagus algorifonticola]|uniref:Fic family protein n=1 Tax=Algoriphagus algorifonticola TaxID=2593007 RepID=UPI0011AA5526|nr:Fic/DOC family N-terminal domain-containing protein [Algoriphagus algorifonticola]